MAFCSIFFFALCISPVHSQSTNLDSLESLLYQDIPDTAKLEIYQTVIWPKTREDSDAALILIDSLMALAERLDHEKARLSAYYYYGTTFKNQGKFPQSLEYFEKFHDYFLKEQDTVQITNVLYQIAAVHEGMGDYTTSMDYFTKCIEYDRILGRQNSLANTINARASILKVLKQYDRALEDQKEALQIFESIDNQRGMASSRLNMGNLFSQTERYNQAMEQLEMAEEIANSVDYYYLLGYIHESKGNTYTLLNQFSNAEKEYEASLDIRKNLGHLKTQATTETKLANLYNKTGRYQKAIGLANDVLDKGLEQNILPEIEQAHKIKAISYKNMGQFEESLDQFESYMSVRDTLLNQNISKQLAEMDARFEVSEKQSEIDQLSYEGQLQSIRLNQQKIALILAGGFLLILGLLLRNIFLKSKKIESQKNLIQKSLTEKEFLLKEIHHRVKNNLQVISSLLKLQSRSVEDERVQLALDEGRNRVRSMAIIHQNLYQKDNLAGIGMKEYLEELSEELVDSYKVDQEIHVNVEVDDIHLDVDTAVPIGLIVNELVSNSLKYGFPKKKNGNIRIVLKETDGTLNLTIGDDGVGFDKNKINTTGFGHRLIASFAKRLKADYDLDGSHGTIASFKIRDFKLAA